ncbi:MAG: glycosyltransferase [Pseudomonadota bacterium]
MQRFFYDLTELFYEMSRNVRHYGIARTVMEVGFGLHEIGANPRFVIFSPGHQRFFEMTPALGEASETGALDLGLPSEARPKRLRRSKAYAHGALSYRAADAVARYRSRSRWAALPEGAVRPVDLGNDVLVTLCQPRVVSDYTYRMAQQGQPLNLLPLFHDFMPMHETKARTFNINFRRDNRYLIDHSAGVIVNSAFTGADLSAWVASGDLPAPGHVYTVPLAHELRGGDASKGGPPPKVGPEGYLLCVGSTPGRKNLEAVLDAMQVRLAAGRPCPDLVLAGARRKRVAALVDSYSALKGRVHYAYDPSQCDLARLYTEARAAVLPSFIEGWGLPAAEALWHGTPALVADTPIMHEVCADLGLYFDPHDPSALAAQIGALVEAPETEAALRARIAAARPGLRRWTDVAQGIAAAAATHAGRTAVQKQAAQ